MSSPRPTVVCLLFPNITQLDLTGPAQVFAATEAFDVEFAAASTDPVTTDGGWAIVPTTSLADAPQADVLLIPGGAGVDPLLGDAAVLDFVRAQATDATWVTSVCTGALVLGAAGLLRGKRATTHWTSHHFLERFGAIPVNERVVRDGSLFTSAGVSAGIDMALALSAEAVGVEATALGQLEMQYSPEPPLGFGLPSAFAPEVPAGIIASVDARRSPLVDAAVAALGETR